MTGKITPKADFIVEASWEVCNKVGGIYTVVRSKLNKMVQYYSLENYLLVGPFISLDSQKEFNPSEAPESFKPIFEKLKLLGIICHYGKWLVQPEPHTLLIESSGLLEKRNQIKTELWDHYKVDSLLSGNEFDDPVIWATAVGMVLKELETVIPGKTVLHCHEWLAGAALLHLKQNDSKIKTVFTTHATMLGRSLAGNGRDLYSILDKVNPEEEARNLGVQDKHTMECASAQNADVFTTVSEITGIEAQYLLGRKPDVLLPNGLEISKFPYFEESSIKHRRYKEYLKEFLTYYFFPYYSFNLNQTLMLFTVARYEFKNKGFDVLIEALGKINEQLKKERSRKNLVVFFWVPAGIKQVRKTILENRNYYADFSDSIDDTLTDIRNRIINGLVSKSKVNETTLFGKNLLFEIEKKLLRFYRKGNPPLSTHELQNEDTDPILNAFKQHGLTNSKQDKVKVVFYPIYLTGADALLNLSYYEAIISCNLGIFPSYYEPWGYTPLEAAALGISSITTDLAGFGRYIDKVSGTDNKEGITVIKRHEKTDAETVKQLVKSIYHYTNLSKRERIRLKIKAANLAAVADWKHMILNYIEAHNHAVDLQ